ncbi:DUF2470 domain-containing protein [Aestuariibacter halophilus]|uniref:DUF2470 domain-containing protein n=1 Tax=Fluctibacter halophilus TaxID=226011 RepID=A0ABS8G872_9ALTE|nr:DUF2470 domain-containing protein [Aestuariibacter halophilus]MCC2615894.1 DUF2470 domain-containing protein [Aestuariibacter halophilus]
MRKTALNEAKTLVRRCRTGVVSSLSYNLRGYPFGSVTPYYTDSRGRAYFFISDIAQHARNLTHDNKMSLTVFRQVDDADQNTQARVTLVGDAQRLTGKEHDAALATYLQHFPDAKEYSKAHDFCMWRMEIVRVRYIGGFGKIFWLEPEEWCALAPEWSIEDAKHMIAHMNDDHVDALSLILNHQTGRSDHSPTMVDVIAEGCYIRTGDTTVYIPFAEPCLSTSDVRKQLVHLTQSARAAQGQAIAS